MTQHNVVPLTVVASAEQERKYLLEELRSAVLDVDKARLEQRLWESATTEERKAERDRAVWLQKLTGDKYGFILWRGALHFAGVAAVPLWERVTAGEITVRVASVLLSDGRWLAKRDRTTEALGVIKALKMHDEAPLKNGFRTRFQRGPLRGEGKSARFAKARAVAEREGGDSSAPLSSSASRRRIRPPERSNTPLAEANRFWASIREQVAEFVRDRAAGADELVLARLLSEMLSDLKVLTGSWSQKISRASQVESSATVLSRAKVIAACRTLSMDPPSPDKPINLVLANMNKKALARAYHPDGSGSDATARQYQEVLEAYGTLEEYAEKYGQTKK